MCLKDYTVWTPCNMFCTCGQAKRCWQTNAGLGWIYLEKEPCQGERNESDLLPERGFKQWPRERMTPVHQPHLKMLHPVR